MILDSKVDSQLNAKLSDLELGTESDSGRMKDQESTDELLANWLAPEVRLSRFSDSTSSTILFLNQQYDSDLSVSHIQFF
jgi:hypothetical protein